MSGLILRPRIHLRSPRAVWVAGMTALVVSIAIVLGVLLPVLGIIGAADASTAGRLDVPVGRIAWGVGLSLLVALAAVALALQTRSARVAWIAAVAAVIASLIGSLWPLVATALTNVSRVQELIPFIQGLVGHVLGS